MKGVSVSVIKMEMTFPNNLRVRVILVHPTVAPPPPIYSPQAPSQARGLNTPSEHRESYK